MVQEFNDNISFEMVPQLLQTKADIYRHHVDVICNYRYPKKTHTLAGSIFVLIHLNTDLVKLRKTLIPVIAAPLPKCFPIM